MHGVHAGDRLLQKKAYKELLEPYDSRAQEAADYIKAVRPGLEVQTGALLDPKVPCHPSSWLLLIPDLCAFLSCSTAAPALSW